jgi:hypothetical protein
MCACEAVIAAKAKRNLATYSARDGGAWDFILSMQEHAGILHVLCASSAEALPMPLKAANPPRWKRVGR